MLRGSPQIAMHEGNSAVEREAGRYSSEMASNQRINQNYSNFGKVASG